MPRQVVKPWFAPRVSLVALSVAEFGTTRRRHTHPENRRMSERFTAREEFGRFAFLLMRVTDCLYATHIRQHSAVFMISPALYNRF
jgi:hypothetical protein